MPTEKPLAKVSVKKRITPDYLICLDDGKRFKSLKRHLSQLGMTPDEYRAKWSLPPDYPMVAPNYSASRSALSKAAGFGKKKPQLKVKPNPTKGRRGSSRLLPQLPRGSSVNHADLNALSVILNALLAF